MSLVVTSFCTSTKAAPLPPCTHHSGVADADSSPPAGGIAGTAAAKPRLLAASAPSRGPRHVHALGLGPWNESGKRLLPRRPATEMAGQMQRRVPAVGDREQIAGDLGLGTLVVAHDDASEIG